MQKDHSSSGARGASLSRRKFFQIAAAGTAATLPAAARAAGSADLPTLPLTDEQQLEACIGQLRNLLQRMNPLAKLHAEYLSARHDGSFRFSLHGDVEFLPFDGDGLYEVSVDGYPMVYWLEEDCHCNVRTGEPIRGGEHIRAMHFYEGEYVDGWRIWGMRPNITRKISSEMPA